MKEQHDPLYNIFRKHLSEALLIDGACEHEMIDKVIAEYMQSLNGRGFVPPRLAKFLEQDVKEEIQHMLKKTTYGFFSFKEFHNSSHRLVNKLKVRGS